MMILRGSLLTQGVTSSSRAWSPWVSSETLMILNLRGSAVFTFWSNLELGQRKNEYYWLRIISNWCLNWAGNLKFHPILISWVQILEKSWSTSSATSVANVLNRESTLQYTKLELMTNDLSHVRSVERLQLESQLTTSTWESITLTWMCWPITMIRNCTSKAENKASNIHSFNSFPFWFNFSFRRRRLVCRGSSVSHPVWSVLQGVHQQECLHQPPALPRGQNHMQALWQILFKPLKP